MLKTLDCFLLCLCFQLEDIKSFYVYFIEFYFILVLLNRITLGQCGINLTGVLFGQHCLFAWGFHLFVLFYNLNLNVLSKLGHLLQSSPLPIFMPWSQGFMNFLFLPAFESIQFDNYTLVEINLMFALTKRCSFDHIIYSVTLCNLLTSLGFF